MCPNTDLDCGFARPTRPSAADREGTSHESNSLAVELLDTWSCLEMLPQLEAFENSVFGPEFAVSSDQMRSWAASGSWFCAAVTGQAVVGRQQIFSMLSVLVTSAESRDLLLAGRCNEEQLQPWTHNPLHEKPVIYLASVISAASDHLGSMYKSLARDLHAFRTTWETEFDCGFSIASGPAGFTHMARNGFRTVEGHSYRGHYPIMTIDVQSAATSFWQELLSTETVLARTVADEASRFAPFRAVALVR